MKYSFFALLILSSCYHETTYESPLVSIQIQDRNGLTETISAPERLKHYREVDFLTSQPFKKVLQVFKQEGKNLGKITTYHSNGLPWQYLEVQDMRAFGTFKEWHPNGQLKLEAKVIGGAADITPTAQREWVFDEIAKVFDDQGHLLAEVPYEKGLLEGTSRYYYPDGTIQRETPYHKNHIEGIEQEFLPDGKLCSQASYTMGKRNGERKGLHWNEMYQNGHLLSGQYFTKDGSIVSEVKDGFGFQTQFQDDFSLFMIEYRRGQPEGAVKKLTQSGELICEYRIKNFQKQGEEIEYFLNSEKEEPSSHPLPKLSIPWIDHAITGIAKSWYNNGKLESQKEYSRNKKNGSSIGWYRNGSLMFMEKYEEDRLISGQYYKENQNDPISTITHGNGTASLYDEHGIFLRKVQYLKGKPVDPE